MEPYIKKLDELIAAKKNKGSKVSKKDTEEFTDAWNELLKQENGFSPTVEKYFYDGFVYLGAKPFVQWVLGTEDQFVSLGKLLNGTLLGKDTQATFRILIATLANFLKSELPNKNIICPLVKSIPLHSKNSSNKILGDAHKTFLKYFVDELNPSVVFPVMAGLTLNPVHITKFVELMDQLLDRLKGADLSKKQSAVLAKTVAWIHPESKPMFEENQNGKNASENNRKTLVPEDEGTREISSLSEEKPKDSFDRLGELLNKACETVSLIREKCEKAEKIASDTNTSLRNEIEILQRKQEELLQQKEVLSAKLNDANKLVDSLHARVYELERTSEELKSTIEKNKEEIDQRDQMIEALSRDRSKQTYEQANRLASQLKVEYDDFKSAENSEMSTELGENMREQLKNIFDILAKSGITLS
jgi:hypothetical protein